MRRTAATLLLLLGVASLATVRAGDDPGRQANLQITELSEDAVVATTQPYAANSLLVRTQSGAVILIDTPTTPHDTSTLLEWARRRWGAYPSYAVNSHWHFDATGGNQVLLKHGAEVISSRLTASTLLERGEGLRDWLLDSFAERDPSTRDELRELVPTAANRIVEVEERTVLEMGGEEVWLVYPGPSHSADSIAVYLPQRKLLYGGCAVRSDGKFVNRTEADFSNWANAVEKLAKLGATRVVPGHGSRFDPAMLRETIDGARKIEHAEARSQP